MLWVDSRTARILLFPSQCHIQALVALGVRSAGKVDIRVMARVVGSEDEDADVEAG